MVLHDTFLIFENSIEVSTCGRVHNTGETEWRGGTLIREGQGGNWTTHNHSSSGNQ